MFNGFTLTGTTVVLITNVAVSLGLALYLIVVAIARNFFRHYTILYMYLFASTLFTVMGALFLWAFGIGSLHYYYAFNFSKGPLVLLKFLVVCWLYWSVLSNDYPSIRFSFVLVFLATLGIFLLYFALQASTASTPDAFLRVINDHIERYFLTAQILLLAILSATIVLFRVSINEHLKGIILGLVASVVFGFAYEMLKTPVHHPTVRLLHPLPYLTMLSIFCMYLSTELGTNPQCTQPRLKNLDERIFQFLASTPLYNRYTDHLFFGFFDLRAAEEFNRWKQYKRHQLRSTL